MLRHVQNLFPNIVTNFYANETATELKWVNVKKYVKLSLLEKQINTEVINPYSLMQFIRRNSPKLYVQKRI